MDVVIVGSLGTQAWWAGWIGLGADLGVAYLERDPTKLIPLGAGIAAKHTLKATGVSENLSAAGEAATEIISGQVIDAAKE